MEVIVAGYPLICESCMSPRSADDCVVAFVRASSMEEVIDYAATNLNWDRDPDMKAPVQEALDHVWDAFSRNKKNRSDQPSVPLLASQRMDAILGMHVVT